jgi:hypothetical protein
MEVGDGASRAPLDVWDGEWRYSNASLGESVNYLYRTGYYTDLRFRVGTGPDPLMVNELTAHRTVLMARSEVMAATILQFWGSTTDENGQILISLPYVSPVGFSRMIEVSLWLLTTLLFKRLFMRAAIQQVFSFSSCIRTTWSWTPRIHIRKCSKSWKQQ